MILLIPWGIYDRFSARTVDDYRIRIEEKILPAIEADDWNAAYEEFDYIELTKQTQKTPIQDYAPEVEPAPQLSELLYFLNIAIFCVLTVVFSFIFLATKMNTFFAFALAIGSSFASIQGFRIYYNKRKK